MRGRDVMISAKHGECVALLPIHPPYSQAILNGDKGYEYRRKWLKCEVSAVAIYETAPTSRIVGVFELRATRKDWIYKIWDDYGHCGGITVEEFTDYFNGGAMRGYALEVGNVHRFGNPISLAALWVDHPPRGARYLSDEQTAVLWRAMACQHGESSQQNETRFKTLDESSQEAREDDREAPNHSVIRQGKPRTASRLRGATKRGRALAGAPGGEEMKVAIDNAKQGRANKILTSCPFCRATPGNQCRTQKGSVRSSHAARNRSALEQYPAEASAASIAAIRNMSNHRPSSANAPTARMEREMHIPGHKAIPAVGCWVGITRELPTIRGNKIVRSSGGGVFWAERPSGAGDDGMMPDGTHKAVLRGLPDGDVYLWPFEYTVLDVETILRHWQSGGLLAHPLNVDPARLSMVSFYARSRGIGLEDAVVMALGELSGPVAWFERVATQ